MNKPASNVWGESLILVICLVQDELDCKSSQTYVSKINQSLSYLYHVNVSNKLFFDVTLAVDPG